MKHYAASMTPKVAKKEFADGTVNMYFAVPTKLRDRMKRYAKRHKISMRQYIEETLTAQGL